MCSAHTYVRGVLPPCCDTWHVPRRRSTRCLTVSEGFGLSWTRDMQGYVISRKVGVSRGHRVVSSRRYRRY